MHHGFLAPWPYLYSTSLRNAWNVCADILWRGMCKICYLRMPKYRLQSYIFRALNKILHSLTITGLVAPYPHKKPPTPIKNRIPYKMNTGMAAHWTIMGKYSISISLLKSLQFTWKFLYNRKVWTHFSWPEAGIPLLFWVRFLSSIKRAIGHIWTCSEASLTCILVIWDI